LVRIFVLLICFVLFFYTFTLLKCLLLNIIVVFPFVLLQCLPFVLLETYFSFFTFCNVGAFLGDN
jgi:hypothetical protein